MEVKTTLYQIDNLYKYISILILATCPSVTEAKAKTCISEDPRCSPVPVEINNGTCFTECNIVCSSK